MSSGYPTSLGGQVDRSNAHKYRLDGEHSSINGEQFYNHDRQQGGGGAIDLVMPVTGYNVREAIANLAPEIGTDATLAAATWHGARHANNDAREIIERGERPAFRAPDADAARWPQVRAYLTEQRQLPAGLVDDLHSRRVIYADHRSNAVFIRQDADGNATGAAVCCRAARSRAWPRAHDATRATSHVRSAKPSRTWPHRCTAPSRPVTPCVGQRCCGATAHAARTMSSPPMATAAGHAG